MKDDGLDHGKKPTVIGISFDILKIPIIGPWLRKLLGGGI